MYDLKLSYLSQSWKTPRASKTKQFNKYFYLQIYQIDLNYEKANVSVSIYQY